MKARFMQTLNNGEPNPYFQIAERALQAVNEAGRLSLGDLRERCGNPHPDVFIPALKSILESEDILKIVEGEKVFFEPYSPNRSDEPKGARLVLETLVHQGVSPRHGQEVAVRFGPIVDRLTIPEIEEGVKWLVDNKVVEKGRAHSHFKAGPRWNELAGNMRSWNVQIESDREFLKRRTLSPVFNVD